MVAKMILVHFFTKDVFEAVRERLDPEKAAKSTKLSHTFYFDNELITEIGLWETDTKKPIHTYIMQATLDCADRNPKINFYDWVTELYQDKFSIKDIKDFTPYERFICDYAEFEINISVDNSDKALKKITAKGNWKPEQLDKSLWGQYKRKFGQNNLYFSKDGQNNFLIRACCDGSLLKKKCNRPDYIRVNGVAPEFVFDPETEEIFLNTFRERVMSSNRVNKSAYTPENIKNVFDTEYRKIVDEFISLAVKYDLKHAVRYAPGRKTWKCVFTSKKPKRVIFTLETAPGKFNVKACLWEIGSYMPNNLSKPLKQQLVNNCWNCGECEGNSKCRKGIKFSLDGQAYYKCVGGAFTFENLDCNDFRIIIELIEKEIKDAIK